MKVRSFLSAAGRLSLVWLLFFIQTNGAHSQALNNAGASGFSVGLTGRNALAFNDANLLPLTSMAFTAVNLL